MREWAIRSLAAASHESHENTFELGQIVLVLLSTLPFGVEAATQIPHAASAIQALLRWQSPDGSWPSRPILRVPDDTPGAVTAVADHNRTFCTAVALKLLTRLLRARWIP
jgi:hypothetical protein